MLRGYWDGNDKPSIEVPVGDFFGLNLGQYFVYQSAFLNCSSGQGAELLLRHAVPKSARFTATNEGDRAGGRSSTRTSTTRLVPVAARRHRSIFTRNTARQRPTARPSSRPGAARSESGRQAATTFTWRRAAAAT